VFAVTPVFAKVVLNVKSVDPSKLPDDVTSPVVPIVLAVCNFVVVLALPANEAVTTPAAKLPLPSRFTIVFGVLTDVAELTDDAIVVIVLELTPPILLFTNSVVAIVPLEGKVKFVTPVLVNVVP
jgi:hypothetical protein